jgi:hypothetical protein
MPPVVPSSVARPARKAAPVKKAVSTVAAVENASVTRSPPGSDLFDDPR